MSKEIEFIDGLIVKAPNPNAPDFVKASISIQPAKLAEWLKTHAGEEWVNGDVKESRAGKWYCAVNHWKPEAKRGQAPKEERAPADMPSRAPFEDDDIPF